MSVQREQVIGAASRLFRRDGFANASMRDVAGAIGLTAPALYRHFPGKQALLHDAIFSGLEQVETALRSSPDLEPALDSLALVAVRRDDLWLLVRRESRNLDPAARARVRRRLRAIETGLGARVAVQRPKATPETVDLVSRAATAVLGAPSQYRQRLEPCRLTPLLARIASTVCASGDQEQILVGGRPKFPLDHLGTGRGAGSAGRSRSDEVLDVAARLIAAHGYPNVTLGEIGAAAGMAGPSLYHHFAGKSEILAGILRRAVGWIEQSQARALGSDHPLDHLVHDYVALATERPEVFTIFTTEAVHLPPDERARLVRAHERFVDTWVGVARPDLVAAEVRVHVTSCLCIVNELASSRLARRAGFAARLESIARRPFDVP